MKKLKLSISGKPIAEIECVPTSVSEPIKTSLGFNTPVTGVIGEVEIVSRQDGKTVFTIREYTVSICGDSPEWLTNGARVEVEFATGTIFLIKKAEA